MSPLPTLRRLLPALALALSTPGLAAATELTLTPYNPGNDAIFQVSSVLVSGQREAILINAQFGKS
ncbi:beta-lactamase, partial [Achromobacter xylosoxidans]